MLLQNKDTGIRGELRFEPDKEYHFTVVTEDPSDVDIFRTLEALAEKWEDYTPKEPLIKDEKVRKAVRAWAVANDIEDGITYLGDGEFRSYLNTTIDFAILVDEHRFDLLKEREDYTIEELCGEEEE